MEPLMNELWVHYFKKPVDDIPNYWEHCLGSIRGYFFNAEWYEIYDFIEFFTYLGNTRQRKKFVEACNHMLERENAAYRFVDSKIQEIVFSKELLEVVKAPQEPYSTWKESSSSIQH
jgi:hypothetical protein